jgi:hypothetical protein
MDRAAPRIAPRSVGRRTPMPPRVSPRRSASLTLQFASRGYQVIARDAERRERAACRCFLRNHAEVAASFS